MKPAALLALLVPIVLLTGCAQFDDAQAKLDEARAELDQARQDAQDAKDRYDRVRSATVVREEALRVVVVPMSNETTLRFDTAAWRGDPVNNGTAIPPENLTSLPPVKLRIGARELTCDPITCTLRLTSEDVNVTWADGAPGGFTLVGGTAACATNEPSSSYCAFPQLDRIATIRVTTDLGDATT